MTAVAPPPSVQSGRLGWYTSSDSGQGGLSSMKSDEVSRVIVPRKSLQRSNSSSSLGSTSSTSTVTATPQNAHAGQNSNVESGSWSSSSKKKPNRGLWPSTKSEPVSGVTNARSQAVPILSSGPTASSSMSAIHQPPHVIPSQHLLQSTQQNGARQINGTSGDPPAAVLTLVPLNSTFEKKHIHVPYYPEVLRIGRQTNAKTVPTPVNGYFDSKVLSRQHAEVWADRNGKIWIRDVKSSNGTFVNTNRLSPDSRESDPHELHENDLLELGIDIASEDQRTIVHQKVSARVEHAGVYGAGLNILDLNFGDLDPASGGGFFPSSGGQSTPQYRGRSSSLASNRSAQSVANSQANALQQQRHLNYWNSPISIDQIVKKLTTEMKQAKQQSQELRQTDEFLRATSKSNGAERDKVKHSPLDGNSHHRQMNGRPKMPRVDSLSRFSDPPAPPPQQPLPEKPDAVPRTSADAFSVLKRSDTEKVKPPTANSPTSRESSQILSMIEALSSAKKEIDSQGTRVRELENLLHQERLAREWAEERARQLEKQQDRGQNEVETGKTLSKEGQLAANGTPSHESDVGSNGVKNAVSTNSTEIPAATSQTQYLECRLQTLMEEMEQMRQQVVVFKQQAQREESEKYEARKSLAEMIQERGQNGEASQTRVASNAQDSAVAPDVGSLNKGEISTLELQDSAVQRRGSSTLSPTKEVEQSGRALTRQWQGRDILEQSSPYASMLGVVLLGVGLMAYLNGWQKLEK